MVPNETQGVHLRLLLPLRRLLRPSPSIAATLANGPNGKLPCGCANGMGAVVMGMRAVLQGVHVAHQHLSTAFLAHLHPQ